MVDEDQQVLVVEPDQLPMNGALAIGVGNSAVRRAHFEDGNASELGDDLRVVGHTLYVNGNRGLAGGARPAQLLNEEWSEFELVEMLPDLLEVQRHGTLKE